MLSCSSKKKFDSDRIHMGVDMEKSFKTFYFSSPLNEKLENLMRKLHCWFTRSWHQIKGIILFYLILFICLRILRFTWKMNMHKSTKVAESTHVHFKFKFMGHSISIVFYFFKVWTFYQSLSKFFASHRNTTCQNI